MINRLLFIDLTQFSNTDLLLMGVGGLILIWILFKVAKTLFKVVLVAGLVIALYFIWSGKTPDVVLKESIKSVLKNKSVEDLHTTFCTKEKKDKMICSCVVQPIYDDVFERNSKKDFKGYELDKKLKETMTAFENKKEGIIMCLNKNEDKSQLIDLIKKQISK